MARTKLAGMLMAKGYLPVAEAAKKLGCSVYTVYRRIKAKELEGIVVAKHWYVLSSSLSAFQTGTSDKAGLAALRDLTQQGEKQ